MILRLKRFLKSSVLGLFFLLPEIGFSQEYIGGFWKGYNTQESSETYSSKYDFEIFIKQDGQRIWGRSYAYIDKLYAEMEIAGIWDGKKMAFEEIKIVNFKAEEGMEWCIKKADLHLIKEGDNWRLEGNWSGHTTFSDCTPGQVFLKKIEPIP